MQSLKKLLIPILLVMIFVNGNQNIVPVSAQQTGITTLVTDGIRILPWDGGHRHQMTPDGRYVVFISGYYEGPDKAQVFIYDRIMDTTELVSVNSTGDVANWNTYEVDISDDGQIIAFATYAYNLGFTDTNNLMDIYVRNRQTGQINRVSVDSVGNEANNQSTKVALSGDGRFVSFSSDATNLVTNDTNGLTDVFVHDLQTGQTTRVSVDSAGNQANGASNVDGISSDGRYIVFTSDASNLVADDTNNASDVFVHDRQTGQTTRVSVNSAGVQGNQKSYQATISGDGQRIAFLSDASNLVANDTNLKQDVFMRDLQTNITTRMNVSSSGNQGLIYLTYDSFAPTISNNGRYVVFYSHAENLVSGDNNFDFDMFVRDTQTNTTTRISRTATGGQVPYSNDTYYKTGFISDDGLFATYETPTPGIVPNDNNNRFDVFLYNIQANTTSSITVGNTDIAIPGAFGNAYSTIISGNGRFVVFVSDTITLMPSMQIACYLFIYDYQTGITSIASVNDIGQPQPIVNSTCLNQEFGWWDFSNFRISDDGRYVSFGSAEPFVTGDNANSRDIFIRDLQLGATSRVDMLPIGTPFPHGGVPRLTQFLMSDDARYIAFTSADATLVPNDTNAKQDSFVYDRQTNQTTRVSVDSLGNQANDTSTLTDISADGRYIIFSSSATNLAPANTNSLYHVYVHDRQTGETTIVSVDSNGNYGNASSSNGSVSDDGRFVAFRSSANNLVLNDTNNATDIFVHDRQSGETVRVSVDSFGNQANTSSNIIGISGDGSRVFFGSSSTNLVSNDTNNRYDLFIHHLPTRQTSLVSIGTAGIQHTGDILGGGSLSDNGLLIAFYTDSNYLVEQDFNFSQDIYIRELISDPLPDAPILIAPADMASLNPPIEFSWNAVNGITDYYIQISTDSDFTYLVISEKLSATQYSINYLPQGTYYWRVASINNNGSRQWSDVRQFTQISTPTLLQPPTLIAPADMASIDYVTDDFTFSWQAIDGVPSYHIQVSTTSDFSNTLNIDEIVTSNEWVESDYRIGINTTYYWRVRTLVNGFYGAWSNTNQFTFLNYPPLQIIAPQNNFTTNIIKVDFQWQKAINNSATQTQWQVARDADFTDIVSDMVVLTAQSKTEYYDVGNYYWRVRSVFSDSSLGVWSDVYQFTITPLPAPDLISPDDAITEYGNRITLSWTKVLNGYDAQRSYYQLQIATDSDFNQIVTDVARQHDNILVASPSYSFTGVLNTPHYWRVRARHNNGLASPGDWSEVRQFILQPFPAPTLISPEDNQTINGISITFSWSTPYTANSRIQIARDSQFTQVILNSSSYNQQTYNYSLSSQTPGVYYWRVRIENVGLDNGEWSETREVVVELPIQLTAPVEGTRFINPNVTFTWESSVITGSTYYLACYRNSNFTSVVFNISTTQTNFTYQFSTTPMTYYCRMYMTNGSYTSAYTASRTFTIINETYQADYTLSEQQLFNMTQPHLTGDMTFALFDITPTGIITTVQFSDGAVVTGNLMFTLQNGLLTIMVEDISGGSVDQQNAFYQDISALFMTMLTETLPADFVSIETFTLTNMSMDISVLRPNE